MAFISISFTVYFATTILHFWSPLVIFKRGQGREFFTEVEQKKKKFLASAFAGDSLQASSVGPKNKQFIYGKKFTFETVSFSFWRKLLQNWLTSTKCLFWPPFCRYTQIWLALITCTRQLCQHFEIISIVIIIIKFIQLCHL